MQTDEQDVNASESSTEEEQSQEEGSEQEAQQETSQEEQTVPYSRFKEVNDQLKEYKDKLENLRSEIQGEEEEEQTTESQQEDLKQWQERYDFLWEHRNEDITKEDLEIVNRLRNDDESLEDAYKREDVQDVIQTRQKKRQSEQSVPESSTPASTPSGYSHEDIAQMSEDDFKKVWREHRQQSGA